MVIHEYKSSVIIGEIVAENISEEDYFATYEGHFEWVNGKVIKMPPIHQGHYQIADYLADLLKIYFHFKPIGIIREDPFVMRLKKPKSNRQPDIQVILNENMKNLKETYMDGAADICIEIVSPATVSVDRGIKFEEYQAGGVTEYWIIDAQRKEALFYRLDDGVYKPLIIQDDIYTINQLPGLKLYVPTLWKDTLPDIPEILDLVKKMLAD
ncbi:MAG: Uma2 family endonuclease [Anaerolineae bacterium]|nr:Uma2 family endonuclease [Anaerolineae bacterium]MDQ7036558.1 Uma2 family endonuclease [Anaerolineae bacterium]